MHIIKRDGEVVEFDIERIRNAINKALRATNTKVDEEVLDKLISGIKEELDLRFVELYPNVENVQDIIEKHLIKENLYEVAKAYILYRAERSKQREKTRQEMVEKSMLGKLTLIKRDGRSVIFDPSKLKKNILRLAKGVEEDISVDLLSKEIINNVFDGMSTVDLEKSIILAATSFIEKDPAYDTVASRAFIQKLYKEVLKSSQKIEQLSFSYPEQFSDYIKQGVKEDLLDERLLDFDLNKLSYALKPDRDLTFKYIGIQTLYERYFIKNKTERLELPQMFWMRVAMGMAIEEEDKEAKTIEFYNMLSTYRFVSSTPTLFHSGTPHPQLSSCYLTTVNDDLTHIFKSLGDNAQLSKWSGGLGNDWTDVRATGAWISTTKVESQGVIPFLKIANDVTVAINRSGKRRGATCAYLETWHLDVEEFLDLRRNTGDDRRRTHDMNTANWIPDLFMKRVRENESWTLFSPSEVPDLHDSFGQEFEKKYTEYEKKAQNGQIRQHKTVSAVKMWQKMLTRLFETGHPWITFKDPCNIRSPQDHAGVVHSSNLCTEITLNTSKEETAVCNLGSVNLSEHIVDGKLDTKKVAATVKTAIRMLDNVISLNFYPTPEAQNSNMKHRPIGLGVMGLQDALFKQDLAFDSNAAIEFSDNVQELISYHAILTSSELAKEKGKYESYKGSKWDRGIFPIDSLNLLEKERGVKIPVSRSEHLDWTPVRTHVKQHGMRNSNTMAIAPTATIATISGCYPCIEPQYKNIYVKSNMSGEFTIVNPYLVADLKKLNAWGDEMLEQLKYFDGNISMIAGIPDALKTKYKESFDIDAKIAIKHTAVRGKWIDQSQSHNVFLKGTSGRVLMETYMHAWEMGLKTTYYLRSLGATQIEKSTLDAKKYGYTQNREYAAPTQTTAAPATAAPKACAIDDPDCEACQ